VCSGDLKNLKALRFVKFLDQKWFQHRASCLQSGCLATCGHRQHGNAPQLLRQDWLASVGVAGLVGRADYLVIKLQTRTCRK
jgi:hypothetical protein